MVEMNLGFNILSTIFVFRIGSNEVMGCCGLGPIYPGIGRDHWFEMLENQRKPIAQWYTLQEHVPYCNNGTPNGRQTRQSTVDSSEGTGSTF